MPIDAEQIGVILREAREGQGEYSQEQAAVKVGTTGRTLGSWERGVVAPPTDTFFALLELYGAGAQSAGMLNGHRAKGPGPGLVIRRSRGDSDGGEEGKDDRHTPKKKHGRP